MAWGGWEGGWDSWGGAFGRDDQGGAARVLAAQGGQDLGGRVKAGHRHRVGGGAQGRGDGYLVPLGHPQARGERADHAAEAGGIGEHGRGGVRAAPRRFGQRLRAGPPGGQLASRFTFRRAEYRGPFGRFSQDPGGLLVRGGQLATVFVPAAG